VPPRWVESSGGHDAGRPHRLEAVLEGLLDAERLDGHVGSAPVREGLHARDRILVRRVDDVRGAELFRPGELLLHHVDGDDLPGADEARGLDRVETDPSAAEHGHARPRRDLGAVEHRARPRQHAAAHEAYDVERRVFPDGDDTFLREHRMGRIARDL